MMNRNYLLIVLALLLLSFPVYANECIVECLKDKNKPIQCIDSCPTPCYDECVDSGRIEQRCAIKCMPEIACFGACMNNEGNIPECTNRCTSPVAEDKCKKACLQMCKSAFCNNDGCEKDCNLVCDNECSNQDLAKDSQVEKSGQLANKPMAELDSEQASKMRTESSSKDARTCFSVCHKYCTIPCTKECTDNECSVDCYDQCSNRCNNECGSTQNNTSAESYEDTGWTFEFWAMLGFFAILITAIGGWHSSRRNRKENLKIIDKIEEIYKLNKQNRELCMQKLEEVRNSVKDEFAKQKIDETAFNFLIDRIERYVHELQYQGQTSETPNQSKVE